MIFPYEIVGSKAVLFSPEKMRMEFPKAWAYLDAFKELLQGRSIQGGTPTTWYRFGRSQNLTKFNTEKIISQVLSREPRYAYDDTNVVLTGGGNGPYYLIRPKPGQSLSIFYIMAILNHPVIEAMVRSRASQFRGGYYSHSKQYLADLPIADIDFTNEEMKKVHDRMVENVKHVISLNNNLQQATTPQDAERYRRQVKVLIDRVIADVTDIYHFTAEDLDIADSVQIPGGAKNE
jgi:hypothetical protein